MRNLGIALIAAAALCLAAPAFADRGDGECEGNPHNCQGGGGPGGNGSPGGFGDITNNNDNTARSNSDAFGLGVGVGVGGDGGSARATGGDAGVFGSGNSRTHVGVSNDIGVRNSNDSSARVGDVGAFSGVDFGGGDFGNSRNHLSGEQDQDQRQRQRQDQSQDTDQANAQNTTIDASDRSTTRIEAADIPVASAAPVFASACSAGVSGQSMGFGGSLATTNPMCDMALAAEMARAVGNDELAYELTMEAATFARARTNIVRRFGQWIPFVGSLW